MIKFFRRIRKKLIDGDERTEVLQEQNEGNALTKRNAKRVGRVNKYLIYAVGEILLVVIGILIALQINNSNQTKKDSIKEKSYLMALKNDLLYSKVSLDRIIKKSERIYKYSNSVSQLARLKPEPIIESTFDSLLYGVQGYTIFMPSEGVINDLIYSGHLGLIRNSHLRSQIASWEADLKLIREVESNAKNFINNSYLKFIHENVDIVQSNPEYAPIRLEKNSDILRDLVFRNMVIDISLNSEWLNELYKDKKLQIDSLITIIDSELEN